jgi:hypothetical protein
MREMKGGEMWTSQKSRFGRFCTAGLPGWGLWWALICFLGLLSVCAAQAEPVAQIPLGEFKALIGRVDALKQREKLQAELIGYLREKDRVQTDYIAKMEAADEQRERYVEKLEVLANDPRWTQRLQDWGTASGVTTMVWYLGRKLILKF